MKESECPCQHDGRLYAAGTKIPNECNTWYVLSKAHHAYICKFYLSLHFYPSLIHLVSAEVEPGSAQIINVLQLALFMGVVTTVLMIRSHMGFEGTVLTLLSR